MTIQTGKTIEINDLTTTSSAQGTPWRVVIRKGNTRNSVIIGLHWGDKEVATHAAVEDLDAFKKAVEAL